MIQKISRYKYLPIKPETKAELDAIGNKGQTYDCIIQDLIRKWRQEN